MNRIRRSPGPKPMPQRERRRYLVQIVVNEAERKLLLGAAGRTPLSAWARPILLAAAVRGRERT
ncbi:MAG TPA: hypothetical protein VFB67_09070 [Candidatus Polarisedimenticolaceae bacterium]|nr:hypothetical protein [Candidatus Polarisedimenticolaceae bacterium]